MVAQVYVFEDQKLLKVECKLALLIKSQTTMSITDEAEEEIGNFQPGCQT